MSILKRQVNSSSDFSSFFSVITYNSSVNFKLIHFLLWTKGSHENTNFDISNCSDENLLNSLCHLPNHESVFLQLLHGSLVSWNMLLCTFLGQTLYTMHERDQSKCKFFRLFSAQIKIHQIRLIFETKNKFLFKFRTTLIVRIGLSTLPQKHLLLVCCQAPLYKSTNCPSPLFRQSAPLYWFFVKPPKSRIFQWIPKILKFFILNTILSFKGN